MKQTKIEQIKDYDFYLIKINKVGRFVKDTDYNSLKINCGECKFFNRFKGVKAKELGRFESAIDRGACNYSQPKNIVYEHLVDGGYKSLKIDCFALEKVIKDAWEEKGKSLTRRRVMAENKKKPYFLVVTRESFIK